MIYASETQQQYHAVGGEDLGEDNSLGYYPDGTRRTLTDEQIAMFRHSEIYSIVRARQVRKENQEAERDLKHEALEENINIAPTRGMLGNSNQGSDAGKRTQVDHKKQNQTAKIGANKRRKLKQDKSQQGDVQSRRFVRELDAIAGGEEEELDYGE